MLEQISLEAPYDARYPELSYGEFLTHRYVSTDLRQHDVGLFDHKWFDYRFMSPIEATCTFIDIFGKISKRVYGQELDIEKATHITYATRHNVLRRVLTDDRKDKARFSGFWRARACADACGMPYEVYIESVLRSRLRAWKRSSMPHSYQLYSQIDVEKAIRQWDDLRAARIYYASHDAYMPGNYERLRAQDAYITYLIEEGRKRSHADLALRQVIESDRVDVTAIRQHLGETDFLRIVEARWQ